MPEFWADWSHQCGIFRLESQTLLSGETGGTRLEAAVFAGYLFLSQGWLFSCGRSAQVMLYYHCLWEGKSGDQANKTAPAGLSTCALSFNFVGDVSLLGTKNGGISLVRWWPGQRDQHTLTGVLPALCRNTVQRGQEWPGQSRIRRELCFHLSACKQKDFTQRTTAFVLV